MNVDRIFECKDKVMELNLEKNYVRHYLKKNYFDYYYDPDEAREADIDNRRQPFCY